MDFDSLPVETLIFSPRTQFNTQCVNISISDDQILEDDETIDVSLGVLGATRVNVGIPSTVTIIDNDSKPQLLYFFQVLQ